MDYRVLHGDCLEVLKSFPDSSLDSLVTDPPAGIAFMGKEWDEDKGGRNQWVSHMTAIFREVYRVLKPGAHGLVWSLPRTSHWTATALEDAGFEIRDCIHHAKDRTPDVEAFLSTLTPEQLELLERAKPTDNLMLHVFGQGFPKSMDIGKAIDKKERASFTVGKIQHFRETRGWSRERLAEEAGVKDHKTLWDWEEGGHSPSNANWKRIKTVLNVTEEEEAQYEREVVGKGNSGKTAMLGGIANKRLGGEYTTTSAATEKAAQWEGWGTALKPAVEGWHWVQKPSISIEQGWLCRKPLEEGSVADQVLATGTGAINIQAGRIPPKGTSSEGEGRWPANYSTETGDPQEVLDAQGGEKGLGGNAGNTKDVVTHKKPNRVYSGKWEPQDNNPDYYGDTGGVSRFFKTFEPEENRGRWPANLTLEQGGAVSELDEASGEVKSTGHHPATYSNSSGYGGNIGKIQGPLYDDKEGASRFFKNLPPSSPLYYHGKATKADKNEGLSTPNTHPTPKSTEMMAYFVKLITPPGGTVLDPFLGSGSTMVAAIECGFDCVGIEREEEYVKIAQARKEHALGQSDVEERDLFALAFNS